MLERAAKRLEMVNSRLGRWIAWLLLAMVLLTFLIVILRYFFAIGSIAMQEAVLFMHATVFMLGAAYTLREDAHVRVDVFYRNFSQRGRAWVNLLGTLLLLLPVCAFILWSSLDYTLNSWRLLEGSREAGGLPGVFLLKTLIPLMAGLLAIQGLAMVVRAALLIKNGQQGVSDGE